MNTLLGGNGKKIKRKIREKKTDSKEKLILLHKKSKLCDESEENTEVNENLEAIDFMLYTAGRFKSRTNFKIEETSEEQTPQLLIEKNGKVVENEIIGLNSIKTRVQLYFEK